MMCIQYATFRLFDVAVTEYNDQAVAVNNKCFRLQISYSIRNFKNMVQMNELIGAEMCPDLRKISAMLDIR